MFVEFHGFRPLKHLGVSSWQRLAGSAQGTGGTQSFARR